jgi:hypothetical protein
MKLLDVLKFGGAEIHQATAPFVADAKSFAAGDFMSFSATLSALCPGHAWRKTLPGRRCAYGNEREPARIGHTQICRLIRPAWQEVQLRSAEERRECS